MCSSSFRRRWPLRQGGPRCRRVGWKRYHGVGKTPSQENSATYGYAVDASLFSFRDNPPPKAHRRLLALAGRGRMPASGKACCRGLMCDVGWRPLGVAADTSWRRISTRVFGGARRASNDTGGRGRMSHGRRGWVP
ncbi:hypothetical protein A176_001300 [Myxococcus hansupus]|uniref:Uncharacterized protein n=1 Tax=Pseudomyxococcus hansupus TaxID=1297742 RepID=A0A0H4WS33_9BACT|nr:hypothetical protein A176_001300 [Myxococcus hansupus]